jgi:hypothetical protein
MISKQQIAKIAHESNDLSPDGYGFQLAVMPDGRTSLQPNRQSLICFTSPDGGREYPLCWIEQPSTRAEVEEIVRDAEKLAAHFAS